MNKFYLKICFTLRCRLLPAFVLCKTLSINAQTSAFTDSVKKIVAIQQQDTSRLSNLITLSLAYQQYNPDSALAYAQQSVLLAETLNNLPGILNAEGVLIQSLATAGNYPLELEHCFKVYSLAKKMNFPEAEAWSKMLLSECYYNLGNYDTSLHYLQEALIVAKEKCTAGVYHYWQQQSRIFEAMHKSDSALHYARMAFVGMKADTTLTDENFDTQIQSSAVSTLLGNAFRGKHLYDSALYYYRAGIPVALNGYMETDLINDYNGIVAVYKAVGQFDSAVWYAQQVLQRSVSKAYPVGLLTASSMLSEIFEMQGKADSALKYVKLTSALKDSLFNRQKAITIQNLTYKEQEKERAIAESRLKLENRYQFYFLIAGIVVIIVIAGFILKNRRQKQLHRMRNSIADDLHDDIGSTLSSISIMSELAKEKSPDAVSLLSSIGDNTMILQENMSDIVWAVNPKNDHFESVLQRMTQFASEIFEGKNIQFHFSNEQGILSSRLSMGQRKNLYLFYKEAINNVAKHSAAKEVWIRLSQKENYIDMMIKDDGKGFDAKSIFNGNGMTTLRKRGTELNAGVSISSAPNEGTTVQLKFKIT